jgi:MbtH protein
MSQGRASDQTSDNFRVLINGEEQYSLWPGERPIPAGWSDCAVRGTRDECLAFIRQAWTDMRPKSLRSAMERASTA